MSLKKHNSLRHLNKYLNLLGYHRSEELLTTIKNVQKEAKRIVEDVKEGGQPARLRVNEVIAELNGDTGNRKVMTNELDGLIVTFKEQTQVGDEVHVTVTDTDKVEYTVKKIDWDNAEELAIYMYERYPIEKIKLEIAETKDFLKFDNEVIPPLQGNYSQILKSVIKGGFHEHLRSLYRRRKTLNFDLYQRKNEYSQARSAVKAAENALKECKYHKSRIGVRLEKYKTKTQDELSEMKIEKCNKLLKKVAEIHQKAEKEMKKGKKSIRSIEAIKDELKMIKDLITEWENATLKPLGLENKNWRDFQKKLQSGASLPFNSGKFMFYDTPGQLKPFFGEITDVDHFPFDEMSLNVPIFFVTYDDHTTKKKRTTGMTFFEASTYLIVNGSVSFLPETNEL